MQREPHHKSTPPAVFIPDAFIGASGVIDFSTQNNRPVHGGMLWRALDTSARAQRRRIAREAARLARREVRR